MILYPRSVRVRMTLWFGVTLGLIILLFSLGIYLFVQASLLRQVNRQLARDLATVENVVREEPGDASEIEEYGIGLARVAEGDRIIYRTEGWRRAELDKSLNHDGDAKKQQGPREKGPGRAEGKQGETKEESPKRNEHDEKQGKDKQVATTRQSSQEEKGYGDEKQERGKDEERRGEDEHEGEKGLKIGRPWSWTSPEGRSYRLMSAKAKAPGGTFQIVVAQDIKPLRRSLRTVALMLVIGFPCALCLAMIGGYFLAGRLLAPVAAMASKTQEITAERLSERLPIHNPHDEFGRLATVFNDTLARLEDSFERLRRFTADASHELRTPLTAIRSVGEVALQDVLDPARCRDVIGSMLEESDRLARLVDSLLTLTRADSGGVHLKREPLDLTSLVNDVTDCLGALAEEKGQSLTVEIVDALTVEADRTTLRQALINLLDNAIRYTPAGGHIRLVVKRIRDEAVVEVCDDGPGIPAEHREKIFERFYRVGKDRSSETGGAGLGLAIARWAVGINGGRIELESEEGRGSTFRVVLSERKGGDAAQVC